MLRFRFSDRRRKGGGEMGRDEGHNGLAAWSRARPNVGDAEAQLVNGKWTLRKTMRRRQSPLSLPLLGCYVNSKPSLIFFRVTAPRTCSSCQFQKNADEASPYCTVYSSRQLLRFSAKLTFSGMFFPPLFYRRYRSQSNESTSAASKDVLQKSDTAADLDGGSRPLELTEAKQETSSRKESLIFDGLVKSEIRTNSRRVR